jgi:hypothetical protein
MKSTEFNQIFKSAVSDLKGSPRRLFFGGAAALAAPLFVKNDDRGYAKSALLTTPVVGAAMLVAPDIFGFAETTYRRGKGFAERNYERFRNFNKAVNPVDFSKMNQQYRSGGMSTATFNSNAKAFYADGMVRAPRNYAQEIGHVIDQLDEVLGDKAKHFMLANVIYAADYRNMSAAELSVRQAELMVNTDEMRQYVLGKLNASNPEYIREMNFRLGQIRNMRDRGPGSFAPKLDADGFPMGQVALGRRDWNNRYVRKQLLRQDKDLFSEIHKAIRSGKLNARDIELVSFDHPFDKTINKIVGLNINRKGERGLQIGVVQPDRTVYLGENFTQLGYAREVGNLKGVSRSDIWAIRNSGVEMGSLRKHLSSMQMFGMVDPEDETFQAFRDPSFRNNKATAFLRSNEVVMDPISGFGQDLSAGWGALRPEEAISARLEMMRKHKLISIGSPGGFRRVLQKAELAKLMPEGVWNAADQNREVRWMKPIYASDDITGLKIEGFHAPHSRTSFLRNQGIIEPVFGSRLHGTSPHLKNLVENLPTEYDDLFSVATKESAIRSIEAEWNSRGISFTRKEAEASWAALRGYLGKGSNLKNVRKLGYLGEGTHLLLSQNMPNALVSRTAYLDKGSLRVNLDEMIRNKDVFGNDLLLGTQNRNLITGQGARNVLVGYDVLPDDRIAVHYNEIEDITNGKLDSLFKGTAIGTSKKESARIREFTNMWHNVLKTGDTLPEDAEMVALSNYAQAKAAGFESMRNQTSDLLRRLEGSGELDQVSDELAKLEGLGYRYSRRGEPDWGSLIYDSDNVIQHTPGGQTIIEARRAKRAEAQAIIEEMFAKVGDRVRAGQIRGDRNIQQYLQSKGTGLLDWSFQNFAAVDVSIWNTTKNTIPKQATLTYDMFEHMNIRGLNEGLKEVLGRSSVDGDIFMTEDLMGRLNSGDLAGLPTLTSSEAFPNANAKTSLSDPAFRAGSVLDPKHDLAGKNWGLKLGEGEILPVLGHEAYGGKINMYGEGEFSTSAREAALVAAMRAHGTGGYADAKEAYLNELRRFGWGKDNYMRARRVDPLGIAGEIQNSPSPFGQDFQLAVAISQADLEKIHDKSIRDAIRRGEGYALGSRQPASTISPLRVHLDKNLTENKFGLAEGARGIYMADNDGDALNLYMLQPHTKAFDEAKAMAENMNSVIHHEMAAQRAFEGYSDFTQLNKDFKQTSLGERATAELQQDIAKTIRSRTTGGSVGRLSNVLSEALMGLETNRNIVDPMRKVEMHHALWQSLRQMPIRAQKKVELNADMQRAMDLANRVQYGMRDKSEEGFQRFYGALQELSAISGKKHAYNPDMAAIGIFNTGDGRDVNATLEYIRQNEGLWRQFHQGIAENIPDLSKAMTAGERDIPGYFAKGGKTLDANEGTLPYMNARPGQTAAADAAAVSSEAGRSSSAGAEATADALREALNEIKDAARGVGEAGSKLFRGRTGALLGAGLAAGAVAGLLTTRIDDRAQTSNVSTNRFRAEGQVGANDEIPGEPTEGAMAPGGPPRRIVQAPQGVRTAFMAPVQHAVDLEVRTQTTDRDRMAEQARLMARMTTDGDSVVTVNYRTNPQSRSLRAQERMRESQERGF